VFVSAIGAVPSPFDCFLVNRGLKTLPVRMKAHMASGFAVARWLEANPRVTKVLHPGQQLLLTEPAPRPPNWHISLRPPDAQGQQLADKTALPPNCLPL